MAVSIAINGFGRIGRQLARLILSESYPTISLKAVNTLENLHVAAHLLKYDSSYSTYPLPITVESNKLIINNRPVSWLNEPDPDNLSWSDHNIDIVIECSGTNSSRRAGKHINSGAQKVVITAASRNPDITLCMGVNHTQYDSSKHHIISGSSCTTNCIAPIAKILNDKLGIVSSLATIIHSYTNTQNILDNAHDDLRRARAATRNLIPTQTSAVWQIPEVIPQLLGKFDGLAIRVPTPLMHLADVSFLLSQPTSRDELVSLFEDASLNAYKNIVALNAEPLVSTDFIGSSYSSIIDLENIHCNQNLVKLLLWHDNEHAYCCRILDLVRYIGSYLKKHH
nr:aldehyde dehydrogenase [Desulfobulbaceae bacterium]